MTTIKFHKTPNSGLKKNHVDIESHKVNRLGISSNTPDCKYVNSFISNTPINVKKLISHLSSAYFEEKKFEALNYRDNAAIAKKYREEIIEARAVKKDNLVVAQNKIFKKQPSVTKKELSKTIENLYYNILSKSLSLNTTVCYIDNDKRKNEHKVYIDYKDKTITYGYNIYYKTSEQSTKRKAILLKTSSVAVLSFFIGKVYGQQEVKKIQDAIYDTFIKELKNTKNVETLVFLYKNLPNYIKQGYSTEDNKDKKPHKLPDELLWKHFLLFVDYDKGYKDASYYVMYLMSLITPKFCITKFVKDQALVIKVYNGLDDRTPINEFFGVYKLSETFSIGNNTLEPTNRDLFVTLINAYIQLYEGDSEIAVFEPSGAHFHQGITKGYHDDYSYELEYKLDSNIAFSNSGDNKNKVKLSNYWKIIEDHGEAFNQDGSVSTVYNVRRGYNEIPEYYNPLDIVKFTQYNDKGEAVTINVPVLFVKYASDVKEWEKVNEGIRLGVDVLMIIAGVATLASGVGSLMLYATIADLGLATTDIIIQSEKDTIKKSKKGKEFLDNWEQIYNIGGLVTFSPVAIKAVAIYGPKMLSSGAELLQVTGKTIVDLKLHKKVKDLTTKAIHSIEISNFNKTGLEILKKGFTSIPELRGAIKLQELGVIFAKGGNDTVAVIYKNVAIVSGKIKEVGVKLSTAIKKLRGKTLEKYLDDLVEVALDNIKGKGLYGGKILSKADLDLWAKNLLEKYGTKIERVDNFDKPGILAQFDANTNTIRYTDDVTEYFMLHESFHAEEMSIIGKTEYVNNAALEGVKFPNEYSDLNLIRSYKREKYVHDRIIEEAKRHGINLEELQHNFMHLDYFYILELEKRNINISKINITNTK
ncbi:zincin-like metallopeptidase toxin domain-containing protein [Pontimicrobium sp. MEBiC06410]